LERALLERLVDEGRSVREIAAEVDRSPTTVRYWMRAFGLESKRARKRHPIMGVARTGGSSPNARFMGQPSTSPADRVTCAVRSAAWMLSPVGAAK
jgi:transposase-like protein